MERQALVIYDSRHGNTARIAEAMARGLNRVEGVKAEARLYSDVRPEHLDAAELLVIGGPTESRSESRHLKQFFGHIGAYDLHGKYGFAFDTHGPSPLSGSASRRIEKQMIEFGMRIVEPHHSAITHRSAVGAPIVLTAEAEEQFEKVGVGVGEAFLRQRRERTVRVTPAENS